jgi:hypothetical protein
MKRLRKRKLRAKEKKETYVKIIPLSIPPKNQRQQCQSHLCYHAIRLRHSLYSSLFPIEPFSRIKSHSDNGRPGHFFFLISANFHSRRLIRSHQLVFSTIQLCTSWRPIIWLSLKHTYQSKKWARVCPGIAG